MGTFHSTIYGFRFWICLSTLLILSWVGCSSKDPIRIGFVAGTSGRVSDLGISGHDPIQVLLTALRSQQRDQSLKETILGMKTFEGLQGPFSFDEFGDVTLGNASISIVRNRKFVILE